MERQADSSSLLDIALSRDVEESLKLVLLYIYIEKVAADVIEASGERKLKKMLCKMSSKRRILRALAILRKNDVLSEDEYRELRRVFRALRCVRNSYLHRVCAEKCPPIQFDTVLKAVELFTSKAKSFTEKRLISSSNQSSASAYNERKNCCNQGH
jgi:hypothetical protein